MLLANARLEANGADSPFRETKAKNRFLKMLDMREEEVMESVLHGGREQLTGYEKLRYDERKVRKDIAAPASFLCQKSEDGERLSPDAKSDYQFSHSMEDFNAPDVMKRTNCYAYACDLTQDPFTGQPFLTDREAKELGMATKDLDYAWGMQPGSISGAYRGLEQGLYARKDRNGEYSLLFKNIQSDMAAMGKEMIPYAEAAEAGYSDGYAIAIAINPNGDFHFFRENGDGTWSQKDGTAAVTDVAIPGIFCGAPASNWFRKVPVSPEQYCNTPIANKQYNDFLGYYYIHEVSQR